MFSFFKKSHSRFYLIESQQSLYEIAEEVGADLNQLNQLKRLQSFERIKFILEEQSLARRQFTQAVDFMMLLCRCDPYKLPTYALYELSYLREQELRHARICDRLDQILMVADMQEEMRSETE